MSENCVFFLYHINIYVYTRIHVYGITIKFPQTQDVRKVVVRMTVRDVCSGKKLRRLLYFFYPLISITGFRRARGTIVRNRLQFYTWTCCGRGSKSSARARAPRRSPFPPSRRWGLEAP